MSKLSDTQAMVLSAASQRRDGNLLPLPGSLRGGAAAKVVAALMARGFAEERVPDRTTKADSALNTVWRNLDDGRAILLGVTAAGRDALGDRGRPRRWGGRQGRRTRPGDQGLQQGTGAARGATAPPAGKSREGTKQALLVGLLDRPEGATIDEIVAATGWQPHTVRGAFAGALKKRLGLTITSEKREGRGRVYRFAR